MYFKKLKYGNLLFIIVGSVVILLICDFFESLHQSQEIVLVYVQMKQICELWWIFSQIQVKLR